MTVRAEVDGLKAYSTGGQRSSRVASLAGANGLVQLPSRVENGPEALKAGEEMGALRSLMSGSGSTCAFLARDGNHAQSLMLQLQKLAIFRELKVANGPVEGVKVIETRS